MKKYIPSQIEPKWQDKWAEDKLYQVDLDKAKKPYYLLVEFPYSSGDLHIGHWFAFGVTDIFGRFKRMQGFDVFFPVGFDAFGLPAENAAIKRGLHPQDWTLSNVKTMTAQFKMMGAIHDWEHLVVTCLPQYYKWNQWIFLKMLEKGIAYKGAAFANWCPKDQTVLADEQVINGKCDRCGSDIVQKEVEQWFLKITEYAERLIWSDKPEGPDKVGTTSVDWPKAVKEGQNNWIGKSEGMEIEFTMDNSQLTINVYTVFPETIFGVTYMVLAPEHKLVDKITTKEQKTEVEKYVIEAEKKSQQERISLDKQKTGVFTGSFAINPANGKKVPVWIADYVIAGYGTGAVMGVPGSDHRDFEFAKKYDLEIIRVIGQTANSNEPIVTEKDVLEKGILVNSEQFSGLNTPDQAREKIKDWMEEKGFGKRKKQYHLHDWSISRQRYWGTPIPIINCSKCGAVPVPEKDLPVELPYEVDHKPQGKPPLATATDWMKVKCPKCEGEATREPETMDGFVDNSWYFYRYLNPNDLDQIFDPNFVKKWIPLDIYFGGAEHTLGHTMYSRFFTKFFKDIGLIEFDEYAKKRFNHGVILGSDGARMSKSKGNIVNPEREVKDYGADAVRLYLAFIGPYDIVAPWNPGGMQGVYHFLQRVWGLQEKVIGDSGQVTDKKDLKFMHRTIKKVAEDLEQIKFNTPVAALMEWLNHLSRKEKISVSEYKTFLQLLSPFAPHITEELWENVILRTKSEGSLARHHEVASTLGVNASIAETSSEILRSAQNDKFQSIHQQLYPQFDSKYLEEEEVSVIVQVNGKVRDILLIQKDIISNKEVIEKMAMESEKIQSHIGEKKVMKTIYVQGKVLNIVSSN